MTNINRRTALARMAAAPAALAVGAVPALAEHASENISIAAPDVSLAALIERHRAAVADLKAAKDAVQWIVDEYRHLWPLAPEEILLFPYAEWRVGKGPVVETDISGRPLMRETAPLTSRLSREYRGENKKACFSLLTPNEIAESLAHWEGRRPRARTEKGRIKEAKLRAKYMAQHGRALPLARDYFAVTEGLRTASGVEAAKQRVSRCQAATEKLGEEIARYPVTTFDDLLAKANAVAADPQHQSDREAFEVLRGFRFAWTFQDDIRRIGGLA